MVWVESSLRNWQTNPSFKQSTSLNDYVDIFEINLLLYKYLYLAKDKLKKDFLEEADKYLSKSQMYLLIFFLYRLIVAENDMITMGNVFNHDINKSFIDKIFRLFNRSELKNLIKDFSSEFNFFELYFHITDLFRSPSEIDKYKRFKEEFSRIKKDIPPAIRYDLLKFSIYYIDFNLSKNDTDAYLNQEAFQLMKEVMDEKYFLFSDTKTLNHFMFINSCLRSLRVREFEWCENFIKNNALYLFPEVKDSIINLAWSIFYYENGNLETSLNYYNKIKLENRLINIEYRYWGLKLFYDLGHFESLIYSIESFIKFLKSESFLEQSMESRYLNFAKCLKKLADIEQSNYDEKDAMYLKEKILKSNNIFDKN